MKRFNRVAASMAVVAVWLVPQLASAGPGQLAAGTLLTSRMNSTIDSGSARVNDKFTLTVVTPYPSNNSVYSKAQLFGHVTRVVSAGQGRNAALEFAVDRIVLVDGRRADVPLVVQSQETQRHNNVGNVALTALGGMIVGNIIGKTLFNTKIGGAVGFIAGALYANNRRTNVSLRQGSTVVMEVRRTVARVRPATTASL